MNQPFERKLGEILIARKTLSEEGLAAALAHPAGRLGETLVARDMASPEDVFKGLAEQYGLPYRDLGGFAAPAELFKVFPPEEASRLGMVPLDREGGTLSLATGEPGNVLELPLWERLTGLPIRLVLATPSAIHAALERSQATSAVFQGMATGFAAPRDPAPEGPPSAAEEGSGAVTRLISALLQSALQKRASDIHIEPYQGGTQVKYRIDGVLYPASEALDARHHRAFVTRIKVMAELDIAESRVPQDGHFRLRMGGRDVDFRVSVVPTAHGEDIVIRLLDKAALSVEKSRPRLEELGFSVGVLEKIRRCVREPYGMLLVTGPTGSGKTTTVYAALSEINTEKEKIVTIEDPVEYQIPGVVQVPVNEKKGLTFAKGLRSILRHDPDRILVGEIRDPETAQIAVQSALTGHMVFSTIHANNACDVVDRLGHMGLEAHGFVSAMNGVLAQRLLRKLCVACKKEAKAAEPGARALFEASGCAACGGTGYLGRTAAGEFLEFSPKVRALILEKAPAADLLAEAARAGMVPLRAAAMAKALSGETTLEEVNRVTFSD